jgi:hypothetical protein
VPAEPFAEFPLPPVPRFAASRTLRPTAVVDADGDVSVPLAWTAPVELEALLPPPTCAVPVEPDALLSPDVTEAGEPAEAEVWPELTLTLGSTVAGDTCTAPVESDVVLLPPFDAGWPVGAEVLALPLGVVTVAVGLAPTEPTWTAPVEFVAVFPAASAGAAVPRIAAAAQPPTTRPRALHLMVFSLSRVGIPAACSRRGPSVPREGG